MHLWTWCEEAGRVRPLGSTEKATLVAVMAYAILTCYAGSSDFIYFQF
jgi:hypothetical protein